MNILGISCGAGIPLFAAKKLGFNVIGNIEWRDDFSPKQLEANFPRTFFSRTICSKFLATANVDMIIGHPKCSTFSTMPSTKTPEKKSIEQVDHIEQFIGYIKIFCPQVFFMDNLPKSLEQYPQEYYEKELKDYTIDIYEFDHKYWMCTVKRRRILVVGIRKNSKLQWDGWVEKIYEEPPTFDEICSLPDVEDIPEIDHIHYKSNLYSLKRFHTLKKWREWYEKKSLSRKNHKLPPLSEFIKGYCPEGVPCGLYGRRRTRLHAPCFSLTGTGETSMHPRTGFPLTIAERRLVTGLPEDFKLTGGTSAKGKALARTIPYPFIYKVLESFKNQNHLK